MNLLRGCGHRSECRHRIAHGPARRWLISGVVPGVGYCRLVCRMARSHCLRGWVRIYLGRVEIVAAGTADQLQAFEQELEQRIPVGANPQIKRCKTLAGVTLKDFRILSGETSPSSDSESPSGGSV